MAKKDKGVQTGAPVTYRTPMPAGGVQMETFIPWTLVKRGVRRQIITPLDAPQEFQVEAAVERHERKAAQDTPLIRALGLAHYWQALLDDGKFRSLTEIAIMEGTDRGQASRISHPRPLCTLQPHQSSVAPAHYVVLLIAARFCVRAHLQKQCRAKTEVSAALEVSLQLGARSRSGCGPAPRHVGVTTARVAIDPSPLVRVRLPVSGR